MPAHEAYVAAYAVDPSRCLQNVYQVAPFSPTSMFYRSGSRETQDNLKRVVRAGGFRSALRARIWRVVQFTLVRLFFVLHYK